MNRRALRWAARAAALATLAALTTVHADALAALVLPWLRLELSALLPDFDVRALDLVARDGQTSLVLRAVSVRAIAVGAAVLPAGIDASVFTPAGALVAQALVLTAGVALWPVRSGAERAVACAFAPLFGAAAIALDTPFVLAGALHDLLLASVAADPPGAHWRVMWLHAMNGGGRFAIALAAALAALVCARGLTRGANSGR